MNRGKRISVGRPVGFCFGVKRAVRLALRARRQYSRVLTLGPLIHNPVVEAELRAAGIRKVDSPVEARDAALVIRSHGCPPAMLAQVRRGCAVIDATCPHVQRVQRFVQDLKSAGYFVIIVGERSHPEVQSLLGYAGESGTVYSEGMKLPARRLGVVAQTTVPQKYFRAALTSICRQGFDELRVFDTLCREAAVRQAAAAELAQQVDVLVVVGGRNSANSSRLADIAREQGKPAYPVETADEVKPEWFTHSRHIGVVAGTSTPSRVVREVLQRIRSYCRDPRRSGLRGE